MCGRFTQTHSAAEVAQHFGVLAQGVVRPRFNIAPTQAVAVVRADDGGRRLEERRWGLVPGWAKDPSAGAPMINARVETAIEKPAFRGALARRRCLVPADGFYEWQRRGRARTPFHFALSERALFAMAGLYEEWESADATRVPSFTILTREANEVVAPVHGRMPVIVDVEGYDAWLDPQCRDGAVALERLSTAASDAIVAQRVGPRVNQVRHDDVTCLEPDVLPLFEAP